jgi:XTP/dITP diphosphohydrolase
VLADDSGLSLPALGGAPGIYSARYGSDLNAAGEELSAEERNSYLLSQIAGRKDRSAFYVCCMVLIIETYRFFTVQETWHGEITDRPAGRGGFGYDPVFYLPEYGMTAAELSEDEKNRLSHRGKAAAMIDRLLSGA